MRACDQPSGKRAWLKQTRRGNPETRDGRPLLSMAYSQVKLASLQHREGLLMSLHANSQTDPLSAHALRRILHPMRRIAIHPFCSGTGPQGLTILFEVTVWERSVQSFAGPCPSPSPQCPSGGFLPHGYTLSPSIQSAKTHLLHQP